MSKVTIKNLAQELGLSIATVSKSLKDSHEISHKTKEKVLELARNLNYTPNPYASSLRKHKSKTIAIVLPEVSDSFFSLALSGIQMVASIKNYHVLVYLSHEKHEIEESIIGHCLSGRVDGVLLATSAETNNSFHFDKLKLDKIPIVFFDRYLETFNAPKVMTNDMECGMLAVEHLFKKGCKQPIFLSVSNQLSICQKRLEGFLNSSKAKTIPKNTHYVINCNKKDNEIVDDIVHILEANKEIDGIVASVEKLAFHSYTACKKLGLNIPHHIKIVAFSTLETAPLLAPSLTTITQPAFEIGKHAATLLFNLIDNKKNKPDNNFTMTLPSILIERESTL